jgi:hypothetical protein
MRSDLICPTRKTRQSLPICEVMELMQTTKTHLDAVGFDLGTTNSSVAFLNE